MTRRRYPRCLRLGDVIPAVLALRCSGDRRARPHEHGRLARPPDRDRLLQGCPWNCFYCHNRDLIPTRIARPGGLEEVRLLRRRRRLLDGVVLTGGEALRQTPWGRRRPEVIDMGFQVGCTRPGPTCGGCDG